MLSDKSEIKKILVITLSNIGDVILTFPVIDILRDEFPQASLTVLVGPKAEEFFRDNSNIAETISYNKRQSVGKMIALVRNLRQKKFDLVVDLRNTAIPLMIGARYRASLLKETILHKKDQHLNRLKSVFHFKNKKRKRFCLDVKKVDQDFVCNLLPERFLKEGFVVVAPGAANHNKRWPYDRMAGLADYIIEKYKKNVVFVGDMEDQRITILIARNMKNDVLDLSGQLNLRQLSFLIEQSLLFIGNDSAPMHLASYLEKPVLAFFGPTDPKFYGPWSLQSKFLQKKINCKACQDNTISHHDCIRGVSLEEAVQSFRFEGNKVNFQL